jgi:hypothetical protein
MTGDDLMVIDDRIALIRRDFPHVEVSCRRIHEVGEQFGITGTLVSDLNGGHSIGFERNRFESSYATRFNRSVGLYFSWRP